MPVTEVAGIASILFGIFKAYFNDTCLTLFEASTVFVMVTVAALPRAKHHLALCLYDHCGGTQATGDNKSNNQV
jgi:hypothetical protein